MKSNLRRPLGGLTRGGLVGIAVTLVIAACGGAADQDVFQSGVNTADGGPSGGDDGSTTTGDDGGSQSDGGGGTDGGRHDGGPGTDAGKSDGGGKNDGGTVTDAGVATVHCQGVTPCTVGSEVCCREPAGASYACTAPDACNNIGEVAIPCDSASDCTAAGHAGDVCCATIGLGGKLNGVECASTGNCNGKGKTIVCDPNANDPCPNGGSCSQAPFGGYFTCQ